MIRTLAEQFQDGAVLCAPTGKAARNLTDKTNHAAYTVHSALGMKPDDDFLKPIEWPTTKLIVVDEASMMTIEMLAGFLNVMPRLCHLVLVGDPKQLLSIGSGNVLPDLIQLDAPRVTLETVYRQAREKMYRC